MIRCVIVDDEHKSRESLKAIVETFCEGAQVVALCRNGDEAIEAFHMHKPDLVFLDIQLQRETGFQILGRMDNIEFDVIFTSAYSEMVDRTSTFSVIDYLLKPIDITELKAAIAKAQQKRAGLNP